MKTFGFHYFPSYRSEMLQKRGLFNHEWRVSYKFQRNLFN